VRSAARPRLAESKRPAETECRAPHRAWYGLDILDDARSRCNARRVRCPFCAEEIQDAAILCRFCGATRDSASASATWRPPIAPLHRIAVAQAPAAPVRDDRGRTTIKISAAFFMIGALFELGTITSDVPLFGAMRGGLVAFAYHAIYVVGFAVVGVGLWTPKPWGARALFAMTGWYTFDRMLRLLDGAGRRAELDAATTSPLIASITGMTGAPLDPDMMELLRHQLMQLYTMTLLLTVACWWGFALFIHVRRAYFERR
jgi:hypothetical protein